MKIEGVCTDLKIGPNYNSITIHTGLNCNIKGPVVISFGGLDKDQIITQYKKGERYEISIYNSYQ